jgi:YbbR domain-containing protein
VTISGPKSMVDKIARAEVVLELNNLPQREGTIRKALAYTLLDENNNAIESDLLEVTSESVLLDSVIVEQTMYAMKTLELSQTGLIQGTPKEGYEIKKISMTPENITVAGWSSEMAEIDALFTDATIDVSGLSDSVKQRVRLSSVPELKYVSATYVNVTIEIGPVLKSKSFTNLPIQIEGLEAGYNASMSRVNASVMITAPQNWLNALQSRDIRLVCDASGLAPGTYSLPVLCRIDADEDEEISVEVVPGNVSVTITVE